VRPWRLGISSLRPSVGLPSAVGASLLLAFACAGRSTQTDSDLRAACTEMEGVN